MSEPFSQWAFLRAACSMVGGGKRALETDTGGSTCSYSEFLDHFAATSPHSSCQPPPSEKPFPDICSWPFHTPLFNRLPWVFLPSSCYRTITCCRACLDSVHTMLPVTRPWGHMHYPTHEVIIPILEPNTPKVFDGSKSVIYFESLCSIID